MRTFIFVYNLLPTYALLNFYFLTVIEEHADVDIIAIHWWVVPDLNELKFSLYISQKEWK